MTLPAFIFSTLSAVTRRGAGRPGHERGRDDDVERRDLVGELLLLGLLLLVGQLARVAALALGALAGLELEELRAERLDLLGDGGAHVVAGDLGAEAPRGGDRLQPGDARAEHEHLGRRDRAGGGHHHRQEAAEVVRRDEHGLVAGDVGLRGQRVHRLRARDARDRLHRERRRAGVGQRLRRLGVRERAEEADEDGVVAELGDLLVGRRGDLHDDVGVPDVVGDRRAGLLVDARRRASSPRRRRTRRRPRSPWPRACARSRARARRASRLRRSPDDAAQAVCGSLEVVTLQGADSGLVDGKGLVERWPPGWGWRSRRLACRRGSGL